MLSYQHSLSMSYSLKTHHSPLFWEKEAMEKMAITYACFNKWPVHTRLHILPASGNFRESGLVQNGLYTMVVINFLHGNPITNLICL